MNKILVLAEKPSVGRDLARVLNCNKKGNGYIEGDKYIVTWALGHLVTLADPEEYGVEYKTWDLSKLPIIPNNMKLDVIKQTGKQYNIVKSQMHRDDVNKIIIATDAGREGELVARWIIEKAKVRKPIERLWISSVTDKAIKEGFSKLRHGKEFENLYHSAVARAEADWIVGINATRALTCKYNAQLSCGRVQTPTLAIIAKREEEIKNFTPRNFYGISVMSNGVKFLWQDSKTKDTKTFNEQYCQNIMDEVAKKDITIIEVNKTHKKTYSSGLYDLTELQRDANKLFDYSAKETLTIMQRLYENHKVLTYPRTDSRYISSDIVETLEERVKAVRAGAYSKVALQVLKAPIKASNRFVDNTKVSDHHAIIPTEEAVDLRALSDKERKIYDLVVKRFLAVLYPAFEYEQTTVKAMIGQEIFTAKGNRILKQGWKEVYEDNVKDDVFPQFNKGDSFEVQGITKEIGKTTPPSLFNEATLLEAMENPTKYMDNKDKELVKAIGETGGLGTVATRADIIEKLFNTFLVEKRGKDISTTSKGRQLLELVPEELKSPTLTAEWEQKLGVIAKGKLKKELFIQEMERYTKQIVGEIKESDEKFKHDNITTTRCPDCNKPMLAVNGKKGKMLVCQDRNCGHKKTLSITTNSRCPNCHKKLELRGEGEGQVFVCVCGHKEKVASFKERKKQESNKLSKKDVAKYINKQKKEAEDGFGSAFDDVFSKLKF